MLDLRGEVVRFVLMESEGITELTEDSSENVEVIGTAIILVGCLQFMLNFTSAPYMFVENFSNETVSNLSTASVANPSILQAKDSTSIIHFSNLETVTSLFQSNQGDVALGYYYFLASRLQTANALLPSADEKFHLYFRQPKLTQFDNPFNRQFSTDLALTYLAIMFLSGILVAFYATVSVEVKATGKALSSKISHFWKFFQDSVVWAVGTWCQQAPGFGASEAWQVKFVVNLLSQLSFLLYSVYCAVIIATLTKNLVPIRKIEHLFQYKYTLYSFGETRDRLISGNELKLVWHPPAIPPNVEVDDIEIYEKTQSLIRLSSERHAHLDTEDNLFPDLDRVLSSHFGGTNSSRSKKICEKLSALPVRGGGLQSGLFVRKGYQFRNEFNYALLKIRESGINDRLIQSYESIRFQDIACRNVVSRPTYQDNLGMTYLASMFTTLGVAYFFTLITLLMEWLCLRFFILWSADGLFKIRSS